MTEQAKFGPVQVHFREDGTLSIYQPDHNHVLSADTAEQLTQFLMLHALRLDNESAPPSETDSLATIARQATVPDGVITTTEGPVDIDLAIARQVGKDMAKAATLTGDALDHAVRAASRDLDNRLAQSTPDPKPTTAAEPSVADDSSHSRESVPVVKRRPGRPRKATP